MGALKQLAVRLEHGERWGFTDFFGGVAVSARTFFRPIRNLQAYCLLAVCTFILSFTFNDSARAQSAPALDSEERAFVDLLNQYRSQNGITTPVQVSVTLTNAAKWHSNDMGQNGYFNHVDSLGRDPFVRMAAFGYTYATTKAENIAAGNSTAAATFEQWRNSPGHNTNMLNPAYRAIGIGRAYVPNSTYRYYWTNTFGGYVDQTITTGGATRRVLRDYDGDGKADLVTWSAGSGVWNLLPSATGTSYYQQHGVQNDVPVPADYDGDGKTDLAVWRPSDGYWLIIQSSNGVQRTVAWGAGYAPYNDVPVPGDYDGDGKADIAIWRKSTGVWYIINSSTGATRAQGWGMGAAPSSDVPVPADYDGDGKTDLAVWRTSTGVWYILNSATGTTRVQGWGVAAAPYGDVPVAGDYDGDGKADLAVWRTSTGVWYILNSSTGASRSQSWGLQAAPYGDIPAPNDYDGDGKIDIAVWRSSTGVWYILNSSTGAVRTQTLGTLGDKPL